MNSFSCSCINRLLRWNHLPFRDLQTEISFTTAQANGNLFSNSKLLRSNVYLPGNGEKCTSGIEISLIKGSFRQNKCYTFSKTLECPHKASMSQYVSVCCPRPFGPMCVPPQHHTQNSWHSWRKKLQHSERSPACSWHMVAKWSGQSRAPKHTQIHTEEPRTLCTLCSADEHVHVIIQENKKCTAHIHTVNIHAESTRWKRSRCI